MPIPDQITAVELPRAWLGGYSRSAVHRLLDDIADAFADALRERDEVSKRVESLMAEVATHDELEALLRSTLVIAERAALETKQQARRESDLIVQEAHAESRRVTRKSMAQKHHAEAEILEIRARLRASLQSLSESSAHADRATEVSRDSSDPAPSAEAPTFQEDLVTVVRKVVG